MNTEKKIIDIDNREINFYDVRDSITKLGCDIEHTIQDNEEFCLDESLSIEEIKERLIEQMSEVNDFINLPAKDIFLDQCLLFLAIRIVELRSQIWDFESPPLCEFLRRDIKCRCSMTDCKYGGNPPKEGGNVTCDVYKKEVSRPLIKGGTRISEYNTDT